MLPLHTTCVLTEAYTIPGTQSLSLGSSVYVSLDDISSLLHALQHWDVKQLH